METVRAVPVARELGLTSLLISYRNDEGAPATGTYGFGLTEWRDLEAAVVQLRGEGHDRLLLVGASMGGAIVGQFMARSPEARAAPAARAPLRAVGRLGVVALADALVALADALVALVVDLAALVDALVVATAEPGGVVLTGDAEDLEPLAAGARDVVVRAV